MPEFVRKQPANRHYPAVGQKADMRENGGEVRAMYNGNSYYPGYQQPYGQQSPYMARLNQMQQPMQPQQDGLIRVTGMDGAKAYPLGPNSVVPLFDGSNDVFYIKTTDGAGFPTIKAYAFAELKGNAPEQPEYVTRAEFNELKEMIANGKQPVRKQQPDTHDGK